MSEDMKNTNNLEINEGVEKMNENPEEQNVFEGNEEEVNEEVVADVDNPKTSTGLNQNLAGMLCYILGFVTGIVFLLWEKDNEFVRFHAVQSIIYSVALIILNVILGFIPIVGWLFGLLFAPVAFVFTVFIMWKVFQNEYYKVPILGDMAEEQLNKYESKNTDPS